jgi:hypothetical protein
LPLLLLLQQQEEEEEEEGIGAWTGHRGRAMDNRE